MSRIAGWVALSYTLTIAGFQFWDAVRESDGVVFLLSLIFIPWAALPVVAAAILVATSPTRLGAALFLALEAGLILSVVLVIADFTYFHPSSFGGIALLFWPLVQLAAILIVALIASLFGWQIRPDLLEDAPPAGSPPLA